MNNQLHNQLLDAASLMVFAQKIDAAIQSRTERWNDYAFSIADAKAEVDNAHKLYGKRTGWGVFLTIFGFVNFLSTLRFSISIVFLLLGILGIYFIVSARAKRKIYKNKAMKEYQRVEAEITPLMDEIEKNIDELRNTLRRYANENDYLINFLPSCYRNPDAIGFMLRAVENYRANTLTDVINLYEQELHYREQERIMNNLNSAIQEQNRQNENILYAMDSISRNQERMNSNLQFVQAMQFINMLDD